MRQVGGGRAPLARARWVGAFATGLSALVVVASCTAQESDEAGEATPITIAHDREPASYNNNTAEQNTTWNTLYLNHVLRGFWKVDADGSLVPDTEFGTYVKIDDDPLRVTYSLHDDAVWSDGEPIDCDDFLLAWAANSGRFPTGEVSDGGTALTAFSAAGTAGYELTRPPRCADGDRDVELVYEQPFADWQTLFGPMTILPAHVLEEQSGVPDVVRAVLDDDLEQILRAAAFYNTGWKLEPGQLDDELLPASGPYRLGAWEAGQSVTLTANEKWWGTPARTPRVVVRIVASAAQDAALQNGEVDVITPQPELDMLLRLQELGEVVEVDSGAKLGYEHLTLNFNGVLADRAVREAFARCVPRQLVVENLISPLDQGAEVLDSRFLLPFQDGYEALSRRVTDGRYESVDVPGARALLTAAGRVGTPLRLGYPTPNPRRSGISALVRDSCNSAGFDVQDVSSPAFFEETLSSGSFDVAMFGWIGFGGATDASSTFTTSGGNNVGSYSNPEVDRLIATLDVTTDATAQRELMSQLDTILWTDLASIPLFALPGFVAHSASLDGVTFQPTAFGVTWNLPEWERAR